MDDLDFVLQMIDPWLDKYINEGPLSLSPLQAGAVGIWLLDAEVNNGGFSQYYFNTRGALAARTVQALREVGALETASLLEGANDDVAGCLPLPEEDAARRSKLDAVTEWCRFTALEREYYEEREDRIGLLAAHLRASQRET